MNKNCPECNNDGGACVFCDREVLSIPFDMSTGNTHYIKPPVITKEYEEEMRKDPSKVITG